MTTDTLYARLGVQRDASAAEIKAAFRDRMKECHPDLATSETDRVERELTAKLVGEAYSTLRNVVDRTRYDDETFGRPVCEEDAPGSAAGGFGGAGGFGASAGPRSEPPSRARRAAYQEAYREAAGGGFSAGSGTGTGAGTGSGARPAQAASPPAPPVSPVTWWVALRGGLIGALVLLASLLAHSSERFTAYWAGLGLNWPLHLPPVHVDVTTLSVSVAVAVGFAAGGLVHSFQHRRYAAGPGYRARWARTLVFPGLFLLCGDMVLVLLGQWILVAACLLGLCFLVAGFFKD